MPVEHCWEMKKGVDDPLKYFYLTVGLVDFLTDLFNFNNFIRFVNHLRLITIDH